MLGHERFCTYCGTLFGDVASWPRTCPSCQATSWKNPLPVAVILIPVVRTGGGVGLVAFRRGLDPSQGELAFPGGYVGFGEEWRISALHTLEQHTGIRLDGATRALSVIEVYSDPDLERLVIFARGPLMAEADLPPFEPSEVSRERLIITEPRELAFPLHTEVAARVLSDLRG